MNNGTNFSSKNKEVLDSFMREKNIPYKKTILNDLINLGVYPILVDYEIISSSNDELEKFLTSDTGYEWRKGRYFTIYYKDNINKVISFPSLYIAKKSANTTYPIVAVCIDEKFKLWIYIASPYNQKKKDDNKLKMVSRPERLSDITLQIVRNTINCVHKAIEFCLPEEFVEILKNTKVKIKPNDFRFEEVEHFKTISGEPDSIYTNGVDWQHFPQENKVLFYNTKGTQVRPNLTCDLLDRETWIFYIDNEHVAHFVHYTPPMITKEELEMYNRLYV